MSPEDIATKLTDHDNRIRVSEHRIDDLEQMFDKIETLTLAVQKLAISVENMTKEQTEYRAKQNELASRLIEVEQAPTKEKAKKHDEVVSAIIKYIVGAALGAVVAYIGLK